MHIMRAVVGWDGSGPADQALRWAADHEQRHGGRVHIVRVLQTGTRADAGDVAAGRAALQDAVASLTQTHPDLPVTAELAVGDPIRELPRIADRTALLVLGASTSGRARHPAARRIPMGVIARNEGITAVVPADPPAQRRGVVAVVRGRRGSGAAVMFAARTAVALGEPLVLLRVRDPYEPAENAEPVTLAPELRALARAFPDLPARVDPRWIRSPIGLLSHSDHASLLVLEGHRPTSAPPWFSLERFLAGQARAPFVVVAEPILRADETPTGDRSRLALVG